MTDSLTEYKAFIDALVERSGSVTAGRIRRGYWHPEPPADQIDLDAFVRSLSPEHRELVAQLAQGAANSAIHGVLSFLQEREYRISRGGVQLAVEPFDTELHFDFVARRDGEPWPAAGHG